MARKGLFELVFILVMLALMLPATTHHSAIVTYSAQAQANDLLLLTDQAIADALADGSHSGCTPSSGNVSNYVTNLQTAYQDIGNNCEILVNVFGTNPYTGDANVTCFKNNGDTTTYIKKRMTFNKTVTATSGGGTCRVIVTDNLSSGANQVDYNLST
jgi:hypothetical protein